MPAAAMCSLASPMEYVPKWKIEAASTALAWPLLHAVDEMIQRADAARGDDGHVTASDTARVSSRSKPALVPSRSIEVSRISPAPSAATSLANCDGIDAGRLAAAVGEDLPARRLAFRRHALGIDGDDDALGAELLGRLLDELRGC